MRARHQRSSQSSVLPAVGMQGAHGLICKWLWSFWLFQSAGLSLFCKHISWDDSSSTPAYNEESAACISRWLTVYGEESIYQAPSFVRSEDMCWENGASSSFNALQNNRTTDGTARMVIGNHERINFHFCIDQIWLAEVSRHDCLSSQRIWDFPHYLYHDHLNGPIRCKWIVSRQISYSNWGHSTCMLQTYLYDTIV
jgi:hypothetical protein